MKERIKGAFTKRKILHFLKMALFVVALSLILLSLLGTVAHATGLVDDTINAENLYSKYPLSNYQLDFYVDNSWSWLPWNWLDGIGKSVQYGLYCITNFVWTISLYLSNATGYVVQEAYKLDFINDMADSIGKSIQTLAGVTQNGFSSSGFYVGFLLLIILVVGLYVAYTGLIKRETSKALHAVINFVVVLVILKVYRNRLSKELNKITNIQNTILSDDREISELSSPLKEVNDILIILSEMEKTVKESTKKQLKQAQLLENSIQSLTHDIQTPASVVSGNLELLEETNMDVNQKEYVKYAQDGISKISEYVEELKTLSKLEQPKTEYVHFNEKYVDNLILLANQMARLKNVTVSVIQKDWTDDLLIEPKDIQKAFQNIISNAVGFSEKSSQIKLKFINNKSEYIVSVIDNGKGFSKESLEKATQKFYSENKARSGSHYGLGLSIVEKIMNEHSGFLQIENLEVDNIIVGAKVSLIFKLK